jgi:hypothetical protein
MHSECCLERALVAFRTVKAAAILKFLPRITFCTREIAQPKIDRLGEVLVASDMIAAYTSNTCKHKHMIMQCEIYLSLTGMW